MLQENREEFESVALESSGSDEAKVMAVELLPKEKPIAQDRNKVFQFLVSNSARVFGGIRLISQGSYTASGIYQPGGIQWNAQRLTGGVISMLGTSFVLVKKESEGSQTDIEVLSSMSRLAYIKEMTGRCVLPHRYPRSFFALCELATSSLYFISGINTNRSVEVISSASAVVAILLIAYTPDTDIAWTRYNLYRSITGIPIQVPNAIQSYMFGDYLAFFGIVLGLANFLLGTCLNGIKVADKLPGRPLKEKCTMILTGKIPRIEVERQEAEGVER